MSDITYALEAKSDQLNAVDLAGAEPVIRIREVRDTRAAQQPVWIYFDGDNNRPWKPSKGMLRVLAAGWGVNTNNWLGKLVKIYCDNTVKFGNDEVGGIRIRAMSDINKNGFKTISTISRHKRKSLQIECLEVTEVMYPDDKFNATLSIMRDKIESGEMTLHEVVAQCQKTGQLSKEQLETLESFVPVTIDDEAEEHLAASETARC
ncbi:hypothetical protein [Oligella urethralis]|uniref:hypothetical protein n=1 Tax=Oligella urethralis TaxID=90245 RepID=UPI000DFDC329|nr:hypothetical protein [Oligella urethralis]SUA58228.1 Uncharacterised protein [Oligella urethralis]